MLIVRKFILRNLRDEFIDDLDVEMVKVNVGFFVF
jgi:hypothetical protein